MPHSAAATAASPPAARSHASLVFVTGNANKLREVSQILADVIPNLTSQALDVPEYQGENAVAIAVHKAKHARSLCSHPVLVEDTSLCFNALHGLPGPYIKWFLDKLGAAGLPSLLAAYNDKSAYAQCVFVYVQHVDSEPIVFDGRCEGSIVSPPRSSPSAGPAFGWDPIFQPNNTNTTFAEMDKDEKNRISHRAKALHMVKEYFRQHPELIADTQTMEPEPEPETDTATRSTR